MMILELVVNIKVKKASISCAVFIKINEGGFLMVSGWESVRQCRDTVAIPDLETKIQHAEQQQLSLHDATAKPVPSWSLHATTREARAMEQRSSVLQLRPDDSQIKKKISIFLKKDKWENRPFCLNFLSLILLCHLYFTFRILNYSFFQIIIFPLLLCQLIYIHYRKFGRFIKV